MDEKLVKIRPVIDETTGEIAEIIATLICIGEANFYSPSDLSKDTELALHAITEKLTAIKDNLALAEKALWEN